MGGVPLTPCDIMFYMDEKPIEKKIPEKTAIEVLNEFMKQNKIQLIFGDMRMRQLKDGAILIERPTISAEFI